MRDTLFPQANNSESEDLYRSGGDDQGDHRLIDWLVRSSRFIIDSTENGEHIKIEHIGDDGRTK